MKVLVTGGRGFGDDPGHRKFLESVLEQTLQEGDILIHGDCPTGADHYADVWARAQGHKVESYKVRHDLDGGWPGAGPRRNKRMYVSSQPHFVIAFPGGKGTAGMVRIARQGGTMVLEVSPDYPPQG